jgi:dUTP pyrophosphatase
MSDTIKVVRLAQAAKLPTRAHPTDAGLDLYSLHLHEVPVGGYVVINTFIGFELPEGTYGQIQGRSSLAVRGVFSIGGVIDQAYRGPIKVALVNMGVEPLVIEPGDKVAQLVIIRIETPAPVEVEAFEGETDRGTKGFGSSGR